MKIALFGYGKMGRMIGELAEARGHEIAMIVEVDSGQVSLDAVDVAIDFSTPDAAFGNISVCLRNNTPVVSGTTGWLDRYDEIADLCKEQKGAFIYASNFSIGVNLFFDLNRKLANLMEPYDQYRVSIEEVHHTEKLDAPSGTAISLADGIISESKYKRWQKEKARPDEIPIASKRIGDTPGTHTVSYSSSEDSISIRHEAFGRKGFAMGALLAAEWLLDKQGVFSMQDVLEDHK